VSSRRGGGDRHLLSPRRPSRQQRSCPTQRLDHLVPRGCATLRLECRRRLCEVPDCDGGFIEPGWRLARANVPNNRDVPGNVSEKPLPDRLKRGHIPYLDHAENRRRMLQPRNGDSGKVDRTQHAREQAIQDFSLYGGERGEAWVLKLPGVQIEASSPRLAESAGEGNLKSGQIANCLEIAERPR
jgi:hypothetical protein